MPSPKLTLLAISDAERVLGGVVAEAAASQALVEAGPFLLACADEGGTVPPTRVVVETGISREVREWRVRVSACRKATRSALAVQQSLLKYFRFYLHFIPTALGPGRRVASCAG